MRKTQGARQRDYVETFTGVSGERVLRDLHKSYGTVAFTSDPVELGRRVGRHEVLKQILILIGQEDRMFELEHKEESE